MATVKINELIRRFKVLGDAHPNINSFGCGNIYDLQQDTKHYPYMWILTDNTHDIRYTGRFSTIELNFTIRIGDKVNLQSGYKDIDGLGIDNRLDIISNTFSYILDVVNTINNESNGLFIGCTMNEDVSIEPFYNEDNGDVCGNQAEITLQIVNDNSCITQINQIVL